jgi:hypothetical protein
MSRGPFKSLGPRRRKTTSDHPEHPQRWFLLLAMATTRCLKVRFGCKY